MIIERVVAATPELLEALGRLIPQLTHNKPAPSENELGMLLESDSSILLIARAQGEQGEIVGAGSLGIYRVPTGVRAIIEDVVVDQAARGQGVGKALMEHLLEMARQSGAPGVSLTSNPSRQVANRLYASMGFTLRQTNCYYYKFT